MRFLETMQSKARVDLTFGGAGLKTDQARNNLQRVPMEDYGAGGHRAIQFEYLLAAARGKLGLNTIRRE